MRRFTGLVLSSLIAALNVSCGGSNQSGYVVSASDPSILGAKKVDPKDSWFASSVVSILTFSQNAKPGEVNVGSCTGTLISEQVVLTAAHCVELVAKKRLTQIHLDPRTGGISKADVPMVLVSNPLWNGASYSVAEIAIAKGYKNPENIHRADIALLKLFKPVLNAHRPPKEHAQISIDGPSHVKPGSLVVALGYGYSEISEGFFGIGAEKKSDGLHQKVLMTVDRSKVMGFGANDKIIVHARVVDPIGSTCNGDSGGPLLLRSSGMKYSIVGITAQGEVGCRGFSSGTTVSLYSEWLKSVLKTWNQKTFY